MKNDMDNEIQMSNDAATFMRNNGALIRKLQGCFLDYPNKDRKLVVIDMPL